MPDDSDGHNVRRKNAFVGSGKDRAPAGGAAVLATVAPNLGRELRTELYRQDLTVREAADLFGVSPRLLQAWIRSERTPHDLETLRRMLSLLGARAPLYSCELVEPAETIGMHQCLVPTRYKWPETIHRVT